MNRTHLFLFLSCMLSSQPWGTTLHTRGTTLAESLADPAKAVETNPEKIKAPYVAPSFPLPQIPLELPEPTSNGRIQLSIQGVPRALTIQGSLQRHLEEYIKKHGNPVAAVVLVEVKTGNILAMAQGKSPKEWHGNSHTALHEYFPAASIFKFVSTLAALDGLGLDSQYPIQLNHRCGNVQLSDVWEATPPTKKRRTPPREMPLDEAFGHSCNAYFAKLGALDLGLPRITHYAEIFGWGADGTRTAVQTDFTLPPSPFFHPLPADRMDPLDLGELAAGLGPVGMSPIHAASIMLLIANNGVPGKLKLFESTEPTSEVASASLFGVDTGARIRTIMHKTVQGGTATSIFHKRAYGYLRDRVGAKTGTRQGRLETFPKNTPANGLLSTWLTAVYPYDKPEVVVAAVVANGAAWNIKGSTLAAEALREWDADRRGLVAVVEKSTRKSKGKRKGKKHHSLSRKEL
jgi:peptidoglycan glycosyltransferase